MERAARSGAVLALLGMTLSAALAVLKISAGLRANSTAVVSDGMESAADVLSSGLVLFGLLMAAKPPDADHPYGHGRVETLTALAVGMLLVATGSLICFRSLQRAWEIQRAPAAFAVWPLLVSIAIKASLAVLKRRHGLRIGSESLLADAANDWTDVFSALIALAGLSIALSNPARFVAFDSVGGALVGVVVVAMGFRVARETALQLMDTMPAPDAMERVRRAALDAPGALGIEKCFARKTGLRYHVDLHLEVDPAITVRESHQIARLVRDRVKGQVDWVADVLVHVEPFPGPRQDAHGK